MDNGVYHSYAQIVYMHLCLSIHSYVHSSPPPPHTHTSTTPSSGGSDSRDATEVQAVPLRVWLQGNPGLLPGPAHPRGHIPRPPDRCVPGLQGDWQHRHLPSAGKGPGEKYRLEIIPAAWSCRPVYSQKDVKV